MSKKSFDGLLPESFDEFRSVEFWEGFFKARNQKAFEWYGEWQQLRVLMLPAIKERKKVLVIGCGNSELSADMYDEGCTGITNIDFSQLVIREMMLKNLRKRPLMKWQVMDMTQTKFGDGTFDAVVDKGGLDALMGEDTPSAEEAGQKLLAEVARVLARRPGAVYLCVTLAQKHVFKKLLSMFRHGWAITLDRVAPSPDMAGSPLQPILATVKRPDEADLASASAIHISFVAEPACPNAEQLADISQVVGEENRARATSRQQDEADQFARLHPGRQLVLPSLPAGHAASSKSADGRSTDSMHASTCGRRDSAAELPAKSGARFSAVVMDNDGPGQHRAVRDCCVFIVPQGREQEWLFATEEGRWQVAAECLSKRVIFVILNRGHTFTGVQAVNKELSPLVRGLVPLDVRGQANACPILSTDEGIGERVVLDEVTSSLNGHIVVEDIRAAHPDGDSAQDRLWLRRMVFTANRNLTQSEIYLIPAPKEGHSANGATPAKGGSAKKSKKAAKAKDNSGYEAMVPCYELLACEYHCAMVSGLALIGDGLLERRRSGISRGRVLVIGLGGGALPIYLHAALGLAVDCVELDEAVVGLARRHFGFKDTDSDTEPHLKAHVGDGLAAVAELASAGQAPDVDVLIVDAGSGDPSLPMSCPPPTFLERQFLEDARACLTPGGLLMVNCVSRSDTAFAAAVAALKAVFKEVYELGVETDVNRVLFASAAPLSNTVKLDGSAKAAMQAAAKVLPLAASEEKLEQVPPESPLVSHLMQLKLLD